MPIERDLKHLVEFFEGQVTGNEQASPDDRPRRFDAHPQFEDLEDFGHDVPLEPEILPQSDQVDAAASPHRSLQCFPPLTHEAQRRLQKSFR